MLRLLAALAVLIAVAPRAEAQAFDLGAYRAFLDANADLTGEDLLARHPAGRFLAEVPRADRPALYRDSVEMAYALTADEGALLDRHGFVVTERVRPSSFGQGFLDVYTSDLPVFLSTDAVLHAVHMSYDQILKETERAVLIPALGRALDALHAEVPALAAAYGGDAMGPPVGDLDVYLAVARSLLTGRRVPTALDEGGAAVDDLLALVEAEQAATYPLFAETCRQLDFSQFTVRGHYTDGEDLGRYFQAMMWLGRTEVYLAAPQTDQCAPTEADARRQAVLAHLIAEAATRSGAGADLDRIDALLARFVGAPDNVTLAGLGELARAAGVERASDLLDDATWAAYGEALAAAPWATQQIRSQILMSGKPTEPGRVRPAPAFLLMGQRFVIDSYVTASVVFDAVAYEGQAVRRMLPSTLDVLFALGNDAAGQLLASDLERHPYGTNLAAVRYLVDSYDDDFWGGSLYNGWLDAIRALNPPAEAERGGLPPFMRTAAWWQRTMNTQLASWAQLRHDNLLYAKQSYTGSILCTYPYSYVEPVPAFYRAVARFARNAGEGFADVPELDRARTYFGRVAVLNDSLAQIAEKEVGGVVLDDAERTFLRRMLFEQMVGCALSIDGWYKDLYYGGADQALERDLVVADVHTAPTDAAGNPVGWVLHAGTGPLDLAVVTAEVPGVGPVAFAGPVLSYYEHVSTGFERITDEAWEAAHATPPSFRPDFVHAYLADAEGRAYPAGPTLDRLAVDAGDGPEAGPGALRLVPNVPNPFSERTVVGFTVPRGRGGPVEVAVYDVLGRRVARLLREDLAPGHYTTAWDGAGSDGAPAASGTYLVRVTAGAETATQAVTLAR